MSDPSDELRSGTPQLPWEKPGASPVGSLVRTIGLFLRQPAEAFRRPRATRSSLRPMSYALICCGLGSTVSVLWWVAAGWWAYPSLRRSPAVGLIVDPVVVPLVIVAVAPVVAVAAISSLSGAVHLVLAAVGGAREGYSATLRAVCYAQTAQLLQVIPICGVPGALVWSTALAIVGTASAHRAPLAKAALAVLVPVVLSIAFVLFVVAAVGVALFSALARTR